MRLLDKSLDMIDWKGYEAPQGVREERQLRGRSVCFYIEFGGIFNDRMDIRFDPGGTVTVFGGTHSHGQGHATVFAQLVHDFLGVPFESIRYVQGDTAQVQFGRGTYGARSAVVGGSALKRAADRGHREGARPMAAAMMEADAGDIEFKDGLFNVAGTDKAIPLTRGGEGLVRPDGPDDASSASAWKAPARTRRSLRAIRTARTRSRSRSIPRPAWSRSSATSWSTTSARCSTR